MKKGIYTVLMGAAGGAALLSTSALHAAEVFEGLDANFLAAQNFQALEADSGPNSDQSASFESPIAALQLSAQFTPWLSGFVEFTNEPDDFGANSQAVQNDVQFIDIAVLKAMGSAAADRNSVTVRLGNPIGNLSNFRTGSDGAAVQGNPLIGNSALDPVDAFTGIQLLANHQVGGVVESVGWDVGVYTGNFFGNVDGDRGEDINLRGRANFTGGFGIGAGFYQTNNDAGTRSSFLDSNFGKIRLQNDGSVKTTQFDAGRFGFDTETTAWQIDGTWSNDMVTVTGWYGVAEEDEAQFNGADPEISHYGAEGQLYLMPDTLYVAARYHTVENDTDGIDSSQDTLERLQVGGGVWLASNTLLKAEWIDQSEEAFATSVDGGGNDFDGFLMELSTKF